PRSRGIDPQAHVVGAESTHDRIRGRQRGTGGPGGRRGRVDVPVPAVAGEHDRGGNLGGAAEHPGRESAGPAQEPVDPHTALTLPSPRGRGEVGTFARLNSLKLRNYVPFLGR